MIGKRTEFGFKKLLTFAGIGALFGGLVLSVPEAHAQVREQTVSTKKGSVRHSSRTRPGTRPGVPDRGRPGVGRPGVGRPGVGRPGSPALRTGARRGAHYAAREDARHMKSPIALARSVLVASA